MIIILKLFQEQSKANRAAEEAKRAAVIAAPFGASNKEKVGAELAISGDRHLDNPLPLRPEGR